MGQYTELYVDQGADFSQVLILRDSLGATINLTNYVVTSNAKESFATPNVSLSFGVTYNDRPNGNVSLTLTGANSAAVYPLTYPFDVKATSNTQSLQTNFGLVTLNPQIT